LDKKRAIGMPTMWQAKDAWPKWMDNVANWAGCPLWLAITGYYLVLAGILVFLAWVVSKMGADKKN
jgi:hypothetical protein